MDPLPSSNCGPESGTDADERFEDGGRGGVVKVSQPLVPVTWKSARQEKRWVPEARDRRMHDTGIWLGGGGLSLVSRFRVRPRAILPTSRRGCMEESPRQDMARS